MQAVARQRASTSPFPGFDGLRLLAALTVLLSHAFIVAEGPGQKSGWLYMFVPNGLYGVYTFFIISGFLLTRSLSFNPDPIQFAVNRALRIVPGFMFCILVTTWIIGPIVSPLSIGAYFARQVPYEYVADTLFCLCDSWQMPFTFTSDPNYMYVKNGSLWSLRYEIASYLFLLLSWVVLRKRALVTVVAVGLTVAVLLSPAVDTAVWGISYTLMFFTAGIVMYAIYARVGTNMRIGIACVVVLTVAALAGFQKIAFAAAGSYLIVLLAQRSNPLSRFASRWGDLSYGVFLFGWPVLALLNRVVTTRSGWELFAYSLPVTIALAGISWWVVERPCLRAKDAFRKIKVLISGD